MIYLVSGEPYQSSQFTKRLKEKKLQQGFEYYSFDTQDIQNGFELKLSELLKMQSLFQKPKFIVVRDDEFIFGKRFLKTTKEQVNNNDILFFTAVKKRISIDENGISSHHFEIPRGSALKEFVVREFQGRNVKPNTHIISLLTMNQHALDTLYPVVSEIEKISLAPHFSCELLTGNQITSPFALTDALIRKDKPSALKILESELVRGAKPFDMVNRILWQFRTLLLVHDYTLYPKRYTLNFHPFVIKKAREALRFFSFDELKKIYSQTTSLYENILFSSLPSELLLSRFFWLL